MSAQQYECFERFSYLISRLIARDLKRSEIPTLRQLAVELAVAIEALFYHRARTVNIHSILHLPEMAMKYGSLLACSSYMVESLMGSVAATIKKGSHLQQQIMRKMSMKLAVAALVFNTNFDQEMKNKMRERGDIGEERELSYERSRRDKKQIKILHIKKITICSESYSLTRKNNDHVVQLKNNKYALIVAIELNDTEEIVISALGLETFPIKIGGN